MSSLIDFVTDFWQRQVTSRATMARPGVDLTDEQREIIGAEYKAAFGEAAEAMADFAKACEDLRAAMPDVASIDSAISASDGPVILSLEKTKGTE